MKPVVVSFLKNSFGPRVEFVRIVGITNRIGYRAQPRVPGFMSVPIAKDNLR